MDIEKRVDDLIEKMTLREKIGQLNQVSGNIDKAALLKLIKEGKVGSVIMASSCFAGNDESAVAGTDYYEELQKTAVNESRLGIPIIFGRDVIHGHHTVFPLPLAMANSFNDGLVERAYRDIAREAALDHIRWTFTPMLDISRDPRWGRCVEGPGEDPYLGARMAAAAVKGIQGKNLSDADSIAACAKHYIGYGAAEGGRDYHHAEISDYSLYNYYLPAFREAVKCGVQTVMNSFNDINGQPVASSKKLLTDILRGELGFDGFVISDWEAIKQLINHGVAENEKQAAQMSLNAGLDMDMVDECYLNYAEELVTEGKVSQETIDTAVRNVLLVKLRLGLFEQPYAPKYKIDKEKHRKDAYELAAECMVLLKNNNGALPLKTDERISLIGPMANIKETHLGTWTLDGNPADVTSIADAMKKIGGSNVNCHHQWLIDRQFNFAWGCDTYVLCLGESRQMSGENNCLADISVPDYQVDIAKRAKAQGKKVVAVLCFARPVALKELEPYCDAFLYTSHCGTAAGEVIADILYGVINPSGKLAMTMPRTTGQIPMYYNHFKAARYCNDYYSLGRSYKDIMSGPMYPFGYGLSYTEFKLDNLSVDSEALKLSDIEAGKTFKIRARLSNTGNVKGKETVQLYIRDCVSSVMRPIRELKGYKKTELEPGNTETVEFSVGYDELSYYGDDLKKVLETGRFTVYVGFDSLTKNSVNIEVI